MKGCLRACKEASRRDSAHCSAAMRASGEARRTSAARKASKEANSAGVLSPAGTWARVTQPPFSSSSVMEMLHGSAHELFGAI